MTKKKQLNLTEQELSRKRKAAHKKILADKLHDEKMINRGSKYKIGDIVYVDPPYGKVKKRVQHVIYSNRDGEYDGNFKYRVSDLETGEQRAPYWREALVKKAIIKKTAKKKK